MTNRPGLRHLINKPALVASFAFLMLPLSSALGEFRTEAHGSFWVNLSDGKEVWGQQFQIGQTYSTQCTFDTQYLEIISKEWWLPRVELSVELDGESIRLRDVFLKQGAVGVKSDLLLIPVHNTGSATRKNVGPDRQSINAKLKADLSAEDIQFRTIEVWIDGTFSHLAEPGGKTKHLCKN